MRLKYITLSAIACAAMVALMDNAIATVPYGTLSGGVPGGLGPMLASPTVVPGKEYSHDIDEETLAPGGFPDPQQIIAWDGSGGVGDGLDYTLTRGAHYAPDDQMDAIANRRDHLFEELHRADAGDTAHLIFSHDDLISVYPAFPPGAPPGFLPAPLMIPAGTPPGVVLSTGKVIGGAGELSYEKGAAFSPPATVGLWAKQTDINAMPLPGDVDGVEVWGPEPAFVADTDKYSLELDFFSGVSVWNGSGSPYIPHALIVAAVTSPTALGPIPGSAVLPFPFDLVDGHDAINLDALMVQDIIEGGIAGIPDDLGHDTFAPDPAGGTGDQIYFSIRQIVDPMDPSGYYATGSEIFVLEATPAGFTVSFLDHGGHLWDKGYALSDLSLPLPGGDVAIIDVNAIEAISQGVVPEPSTLLLGVVGVWSLAWIGRRRENS